MRLAALVSSSLAACLGLIPLAFSGPVHQSVFNSRRHQSVFNSRRHQSVSVFNSRRHQSVSVFNSRRLHPLVFNSLRLHPLVFNSRRHQSYLTFNSRRHQSFLTFNSRRHQSLFKPLGLVGGRVPVTVSRRPSTPVMFRGVPKHYWCPSF